MLNLSKPTGEIKILDASRHGPTNYTKWELYESDSDEEEKEPILPRHDPNFIALEKSMNADLKKKEEILNLIKDKDNDTKLKIISSLMIPKSNPSIIIAYFVSISLF